MDALLLVLRTADDHTDAMDKSKVTGIDQVDKVQDGVNGLVSGQVGQGGMLQPVGDMASKEGINRAERGGKDDKGSMTGTSMGDSVANKASSGGSSIANGASSAAGTASDGAKGAGSYIGSFVSLSRPYAMMNALLTFILTVGWQEG